MSVDLFVFAGEKSGDLHAESVLRTLKALHPDLIIAGVGGPKMRSIPIQAILNMEQFQVMGFLDVFCSLPSLISHFYTVCRAIERLNPKMVLTVDYPGFNLRLARHLRKRGYKGKICHYICPSVWAWGKNRIPIMAKNLDLLLTILPFEKEIFRHTPLPVVYVGNPLVVKIKTYPYQPLPFRTEKKIIALFPGSRTKEIQRNLALQLQACKFYRDFHIAISLSEERYIPLIQSILQQEGLAIGNAICLVSGNYTYELMRAAYFAIAKSGTVTLELALHRIPTIVTYGISKLDLFIAKDILRIRLPFYCLVNIIANKEIFAELIGPHFTKENLVTKVQDLLIPSHYAQCKQNCEEIISLFRR